MKNKKKSIKELINEIENLNIRLDKKMKLLNLLDKVFRENYGVIYLSNKELEEKDILIRSI